ncbi:LysE family translocator [Curvivirga sp.]|uniref:LysE family translocator n=1 Tax=Curvivirga sp. TaxID=2856848 RepID=UPI003B5B3EB9
MVWEVWLSFTLISIANIVTPGPAILNTIRRAMQLGLIKTIPTISGNALGLFTSGVICASGVATIIMTSDTLWILFQYIGIGYLAWLGLKLIFKTEKIVTDTQIEAGIRGKLLFSEAYILAVTNPKAILFFIALFPQVIKPQEALFTQSIILTGTYCVLSITSLLGYSTAASLLRTRFITQRRYQVFRIISGIILLLIAIQLYLDL